MPIPERPSSIWAAVWTTPGGPVATAGASIWNIDLPDVIKLRDRLLPPGEREKNLAFDLKDPRWWDAVRTDPDVGRYWFAAGVFYYFTGQKM